MNTAARYFAKLTEEAGVPPGVVNVVPGFGETAGAALARHPGLKRMSFTGSSEVGRLLGEAWGRESSQRARSALRLRPDTNIAEGAPFA